MHSVRVFLNGAAGSADRRDFRNLILRQLFRSSVEFIQSHSKEDFIVQLRRAAEEKIDAVISIGGDGTFNTVLQELATTELSILVIPAGTANDLASELGISGRVKRAVECIRRNETTYIDLIRINDRYMATNGGIGIVSDVAEAINVWRKKVPGFRTLMSGIHHNIYALGLAGYAAFGQYRYYDVDVTSDQYSGRVTTPLLLINNQPCIAKSFSIAPHTVNSDGKFNVTIFLHQTWLQFITALVRVRQRLPLDYDQNIISFETSDVLLASRDGKELVFFGDGEDLARGMVLHATAKPGALRVFRPSEDLTQKERKGKNLEELIFV